MTISVAGHSFHSITPGERCLGENCEGIQSLVELCALADILTLGERGVAHYGTLSPAELTEIRDAARVLRELMEKVFP